MEQEEGKMNCHMKKGSRSQELGVRRKLAASRWICKFFDRIYRMMIDEWNREKREKHENVFSPSCVSCLK